MKLLLFGFAVVFLVSQVHGFFGGGFGDGPWGDREGGFGGRMPRPRGPPPFPFPKCKEFMNMVHQKMRESGSGPRSCRGESNHDECKFKEMTEARMKVTETPPEECMDQIMGFMMGTPPTTTTVSAST